MPSLEQLQNLLAADESDSFVLYALAQEHAKRGEHDLAVSFYDRCLAVEPNELYAYFHKARSLEALDQTDAAAACLRVGAERAEAAGDAKALGEITGYLQSLGGA
ncbi:MAG: tetratricopeptide repeat protein [Planctomycetota bacterium]